MRYDLRISTLFISLLVMSLAMPIAANAEDKILATVNEKNITESALMRYQKRRGIPKDMPAEQQRKIMVEELINRELIYQDAVAKELDQKPDVLAELEVMRKNLIASAMLKNVSNTATFTDDELKKQYEEFSEKLAMQEYKARHILLDNENTAKDIIKKLDKGSDFAKLAEEYSIGPSNTKGGDLGWFKPGEMVKPFADAVIALPDATYTKTPVKTDFGWHVILREQARKVPAPPYEDMKEQIKMRMQNAQVESYIESLRKKAKIERK